MSIPAEQSSFKDHVVIQPMYERATDKIIPQIVGIDVRSARRPAQRKRKLTISCSSSHRLQKEDTLARAPSLSLCQRICQFTWSEAVSLVHQILVDGLLEKMRLSC